MGRWRTILGFLGWTLFIEMDVGGNAHESVNEVTMDVSRYKCIVAVDEDRKRDGVENQPYAEEVDMEEDQSPQQAATVIG